MLRTTHTDISAERIHPWQYDDSLTAYENFLAYAGEEANERLRNQISLLSSDSVEADEPPKSNNNFLSSLSSLFSSKMPTPIKPLKKPAFEVDSICDKFKPLTTEMNGTYICNTLVIRNTQQVELMFDFTKYVDPCSISIDSTGDVSQLMIAYRNIVPKNFSSVRSMAGCQGYHEYLIDGSNHTGELVKLEFSSSSDLETTPLRIVLENCRSTCHVKGLDEQAISKIFLNNSKYNGLEILPINTSNRPSSRN